MKLTNKNNINLSVAVWLCVDQYDHSKSNNEISTTALLKSTRQLVLSQRLKPEQLNTDISTRAASSIGTAIHNDIYYAWIDHYKEALLSLGHSEDMVERIKINPKPEELTDECVAVYMEQRAKKPLGNYVVTGKYDFVGDGRLEDFKSCGTFSYISGTNELNYKLQGSIYRWLNPDKITEDTMIIQYIFTDWKAWEAKSKKEKGYPQSKIMSHPVKLLSIEDTEKWLKEKLNALDEFSGVKESDLPMCTNEELWRSAIVYSYYKNPAKLKKATANFNSYPEAHARLLKDGSCGIIKEKPSTVKACAYCSAFPICTQKDQYILDGSLIIDQ